jgi:hypothetical protein
MQKRLLSILIVAIFLSSIVLAAAPVKATKIPDYIPVYENDPRAGTLEMPSLDASSGMMTSDEMTQLQSAPPVGTVVWDWYLRALTGNPYMTLKGQVGKAEVWLAQNLLFPTGDPRNSDPRLTPPDTLLQYIAQEFDSNMYPTITAHFSYPKNRDGTNNYFQYVWPTMPYRWNWIPTDDPQRVIIKVFNIRDQNYVDPTYPYYVVGFFSSFYTDVYYDRNMIHIDSWDWQNRTGPNVSRPFVYDSTLAHEYQHNIHSDGVPGDSSYMNEGCSMYAEVLCGYGVSWSHVNSYLYTPDNSLTKWGDQGDLNILADYGQALLWAIYLEDNYSPPGGSFLSQYMAAGIPADAGINAGLAYFGYSKTFDDIYFEWNLANYLRDMKKAPYTYKTIDLNPATNPDVIPMNIHAMSGKIPKKERSFSFYGSDFGSTITILGYDTGVVDLAPYSSDFILFTNGMEDTRVLSFEGGAASEIPYGWEMVGGEWYSDGIDLLNTLLAGTVHVDASDPTLEMTTYWDIEDYWDFGFVQVSTDGGNTWTSLANEYTTTDYDPAAYFPIVQSLPGLTGWSGGYVTMTFDLSAYAGEDVMLGFRYMTDWGTLYEGWYISSVKVSGNDIDLTSFQKVPGYPSYFTVTLAYIDPIADMVSHVETLNISHPDETGQATISAHGKQVLVIVSNPSDPTEFAYGVADYKITLSKP